MKLKSLSLRNFKGIKEFGLNADGNNVNIYGANESGKTTVNDAFAWIVSGKSSLDLKDFGIKPIGSSGIDCEVEAVLLIDGKEASFKKTYKEVWTKKRGSAQSEFSGHTTEYWINGVPKQLKEYQSVINTIIGEEQFKLLTSPRYYNESLDWKKRRDLLMLMCGITGGELNQISDALKVLKANQVELNKKLKDIPVRIDEATRALPVSLDDTNLKNIDELRRSLSSLQERKAGLNAGGGAAEINSAIAAVDMDLHHIKNQHSNKVQSQINKVRQDKKVIDDQIGNIESQISFKRRKSGELIQEEKDLKDALAKLRERYIKKQEERSKVESEEYTGDTTCFNCKQDLPDNMVENAKAAFNRNKSERLEKITAELSEIDKKGKASRDRLEEFASQGNSATEGINSLNQQLTALQGEERTLKILIDQLNSMVGQAEGLPEYEEVAKKKAPLQQQLRALQQGNNNSALVELNKEIAGTQGQIDIATKLTALIDQRKQGLARIQQLKDQEKELASQYEDKEKQVFETETQLRETVKALEESINGKFETISFKLFNTLINGGIEDCCIASSKTGVPYPDMSNSQKIRAGLEIIRTMSRHYGIEAPVFIDNAESCDHLVPMDCQVIQLIVSPEDKVLRVEKAEIKEEVLV